MGDEENSSSRDLPEQSDSQPSEKTLDETTIEDQQPVNVQTQLKKQKTWMSLLKRLWWAIALVILVIVGLIVYLVYENHRTAVYNAYLQGASDAMKNNNYGLAITDYTKALSYKNVPSVQSELANAKELQSEHQAYESGMAALSSGNYGSAITDFNKVTIRDKVDYTDAQKEIATAKADISAQKDQMIATTMYDDAQSILKDINSLLSDVNNIATTEDGITNDAINSSAFSSDLSTIQSALGSLGIDLRNLENDGGQFNTDSQGLHDPKINTIAAKIVTSVTQLENDYSEMDSITNNDVNDLQTQASNDAGYAFRPYINPSRTTQWNSDIKDSDNQNNILTNLVSQLKAYSKGRPTTSGSSDNNL